MTKYIFILFIFYSCGTRMEVSPKSIDDTFKAWNVATSNSIINHISVAQNEHQKALYENRLQTLKGYLQIANYNDVNQNSIRYQLLRQKSKEWGKKFYIIEANQLGEKVSIISYIVATERGISKIFKYEFISSKWIKVNEHTINDSFKYYKGVYSNDFGEGQNQNDVIITYVEHSIVVSSDFFLAFTMKPLVLE